MSASIKAGVNPLMAHSLVADMETNADNKEKSGRNEQ